MAKNSLFATLLRSPWWVSLTIALAVALLAGTFMPKDYRVVGALSSMPFVVIAVMAARRQWHLPSAARVAQTVQAAAAMNWSAFSKLLEQAFVRDGYTVLAGTNAPVDFQLERQGRTMLVSARRWKSARIGLDALQQLQAAREAADVEDALYIGLGELTDNARPFAAEKRIAVWQAAELALALRGLALPPASDRKSVV